MRILLLSDKMPWPPDNGGAYATIDMIRMMKECGHDITVMALNTVKHYSNPDLIPSGISDLCRIISIETNLTINPFRLFTNLLFSLQPYKYSRLYSKVVQEAFDREISSVSYNIIQFEGLWPYLINTSKLPNSSKIIYRAHNAEHVIWSDLASLTVNPLRKLYLKVLARRTKRAEAWLVKKASGSIFISDVDKDLLSQECHTGNNIIIIPNPFHWFSGEHVGTGINACAGYIGSLDWQPNQQGLKWFMEKVLPEIRQCRNDFRFRVAGRNPSSALLRCIERQDAEFTGSPVDSSVFLNTIKILVIPLFAGSGVRIKILEAIAGRKAVVTTTKGAEGLPAELKQELLITDDPNRMAGFITDLISDEENLESYSKRIRANLEAWYKKSNQEKKLNNYYFDLTNDN